MLFTAVWTEYNEQLWCQHHIKQGICILLTPEHADLYHGCLSSQIAIKNCIIAQNICGGKKKNPLKKIPKLLSRGWTEQIPAERCAAWWNLGVNTCPRCVTSPAVRLQCGSSCISHRLPKVPGAPPPPLRLCSALINYSTYYKRHAGFRRARRRTHGREPPLAHPMWVTVWWMLFLIGRDY